MPTDTFTKMDEGELTYTGRLMCSVCDHELKDGDRVQSQTNGYEFRFIHFDCKEGEADDNAV